MTMNRLLLTAALFAALPFGAGAQVAKQVEVTKEYVPSVAHAAKLPIVPDMTDTTRMRPEISESAAPFLLNMPLELQPIRPANVTYWTFNRPLPCYLKLGAGYPLNSTVDFHVATQHPDTGYALGFVQHEGRYADIRNDFGIENNSLRMTNRVGAAAGKQLGRHMLEAAASYENRLYHRYGAYAAPSVEEPAGIGGGVWLPAAPGALIDFGEAGFAMRIGDDFQDLSRINFDVTARAGLFFDQTVWAGSAHPRQTDFHASGKIAKAFGRHRFALEAGYDRLDGRRALDGFKEHLIRAGVRYGHESATFDFEVGADYAHDRIAGTEHGNYVLPFVRLQYHLGTHKVRPFFEVDGSVRDNSYRSLTRLCPYVAPATVLDESSVDYNGRLGICGDVWHERFAYRVYAACSIRDRHDYWYASELYDSASGEPLVAAVALRPALGKQIVASFHGEAEFRPVSALHMELGVHGYLYHDKLDYGNGAPSFEGNFGIRYAAKRISFGVSASMQTSRRWTVFRVDVLSADQSVSAGEKRRFEAPLTFGLRAFFDWRISDRIGIFAEGDNLLNKRQYRYPFYPEYGANFTAGVKLAF